MTIETGWQERTLGDICSLRRELMEPTSTGAHRYIGLEHIDPGLPSLRRWGTDRHLKSTKSRFYAGDILYGKLRPYLDKAAVAEWEGVCSTDILTLQPHKDEADSQYIGFLLHTSLFLSYAVATTSGVNHPRTSWTDIARFSYPLPPVQEQRAIAVVLSKILAAVELQEKIVATLKELKAATMAKLFREGLRGEPLKQTEVGEIPESWQIVRLGDYCRISSGGTPARDVPEYWNGDIPWVKTTEIDYRPIMGTEECITKAGLQNSSAKLFPRGTLLMAMYGQGVTRGKVALLEIEAATNQACAALSPDERLDPGYLYAFCASAYNRIRELAHGANQRNLSADIIREIRLPLPSSLEEQREICGAVRAIESRLQLAAHRMDALKSLFSSMLHLLMSGRVRVTPKMIALQRVADRAARRAKWSGKVDEKVLEQVVKRIVEAVAPEKIILFGSAARGEMGPDSDLDLLIVKSDVHRLATAQMIEHSLTGITIPTDIVVATPKDIEVHKNTIGLIYRPVLQEGKILYAA